jgi:hypothetical protein
MQARVARDLKWLQEQCDRVVVVAHSQGAAIAHEILKAKGYPKDHVRAFITIGQGITKLHVLRHLELDPAARQKALLSRALVILGLLVAGLPAFAWLLDRWVDWPVIEVLTALSGLGTVAILVVGFLGVALGVIVAVKAVGAKAQRDLPLPRDEEDFKWIDYFASADPVSNGPLSPESRQGPNRCDQVVNRASVLTDHNGYLRNQDQFMSMLVNDLVAHSGKEKNNAASQPVPLEVLEEVRQRRRRLVKWLIAGRWSALAVGMVVWLQNYEEVFGIRLDRYVPHAMDNMGAPVVRLAPALFVMMGFYVVVIILWRTWESLWIRRFFEHAGRTGQEPGSGGPEPQEPRRLASQTT